MVRAGRLSSPTGFCYSNPFGTEMSGRLEALEQASGATLMSFADTELPARFSDVRAEWTAVRTGCGLLDAGFRALLRLTGNDRITFLQGMVTNDVAALHAGDGVYAAFLTQQGRVVADVRVYALADELWVDVLATRRTALRDGLERYIIADEVEFAADDVLPLIVLEGPHAARVVLAVTGEAVAELVPYAHRAFEFEGHTVRITAVTHTGEPGYLLCGSPEAAAALWTRSRSAGAEPVGMEALDVLRIEAGIPWAGRDMDESLLISEVGLESAISYKKGCYLGQEVVERVAARGQVHRKLVGIECHGAALPPSGAKLLHDGKEVGWVTSSTWSPAREAVIALGYARRECAEPGSELQIELPHERSGARIVALPFQ
jgi:aminomethyltransferase